MTDRKIIGHFGRGNLAIIAGNFFWAIGAVVIKNALGDTPESFRSDVFNGLRMPLVSFLLFLAVAGSGRSIRLERRDVPLLAFSSFIGMFLFQVLNLKGLNLSSVSNFAVLMATIPLCILVLSAMLRIENLNRWTVLGILTGMSGTCALSFQGGAPTLHPGDALILLSCVFWAVYTILTRGILERYSPALTMAWVLLFASIFQTPLLLMELPGQSLAAISPENWMNFFLAAVVSLFGGNFLFFYAVQKIGPTRVGAYSFLEPVFTLILAFLWRGERISFLQVSGLVLVFIGIGLTHIRGAAPPDVADASVKAPSPGAR